jgi:hypothetical protein
LKPVKLGRKKTYKTLDSLDTVVIELRGHSYEELVESGLDGRKLVRTNEDGTWKLMLAPGSLMRVSQEWHQCQTMQCLPPSFLHFPLIPSHGTVF